MVEMYWVVMYIEASSEQVANDSGVVRYSQVQCILDGTNRGYPMNIGANPTDTLGEKPGFFWFSALEDGLHPTEKGSGRPGIGNHSVVDFHFNFQVTLNPGDRIDDYAFRHDSVSLCDISHQLPTKTSQAK